MGKTSALAASCRPQLSQVAHALVAVLRRCHPSFLTLCRHVDGGKSAGALARFFEGPWQGIAGVGSNLLGSAYRAASFDTRDAPPIRRVRGAR